jgi:hypothetical protein
MFLERFFPEANRLRRARDRSFVVAQALRMLGFTWPRGFLLGAVLLIPSVLLTNDVNRLLRAGLGMEVHPLLAYAIACIAVQAVWIVAVGRSVRRRIWRHLYELGVPVCPTCGYDLSGNLTRTCPECGHTPVLTHSEQAALRKTPAWWR